MTGQPIFDATFTDADDDTQTAVIHAWLATQLAGVVPV